METKIAGRLWESQWWSGDDLLTAADFLESIGLASNSLQQTTRLLQAYRKALRTRVEFVLAQTMNAGQLSEWSRLVQCGDQLGCRDWLASHRPFWSDVVMSEHLALAEEVQQKKRKLAG